MWSSTLRLRGLPAGRPGCRPPDRRVAPQDQCALPGAPPIRACTGALMRPVRQGPRGVSRESAAGSWLPPARGGTVAGDAAIFSPAEATCRQGSRPRSTRPDSIAWSNCLGRSRGTRRGRSCGPSTVAGCVRRHSLSTFDWCMVRAVVTNERNRDRSDPHREQSA